MAFEISETHELLGVLENFPVEQPSYFLDSFFRREYQSQDQNIDFDVLDQDRRLAPFVSPIIQGQPMLLRGYTTRSFKPAYIKPKNRLDPQANFLRRPGESYGGTLSPAQREDAIIASTQLMHRTSIMRTWEWMAAQAVQFGSVTVEGENYPTQVVSFGRDPGNTVTLTGGALWSNPTTARPLDDIAAWARRVQRSGRKPTRLTMGIDASAAFFATEQVKAEFDVRRNPAVNDSFQRFNLVGDSLVYHGPLAGGIEVVTFHDFYHDNLGQEIPYMDPGAVLLTGDVDGVRAFGAIIDPDSEYQALPIFPKMWKEMDPGGIMLMTQSAPLMVPMNPNASVYANVLA